jgi:hypothetical protein
MTSMVWNFNALGDILGEKVQREARIEKGRHPDDAGVACRRAETAGQSLPPATDQDHSEAERRGGEQTGDSSASSLSSASSSSEEAEAEVEDEANGASNLLQVTIVKAGPMFDSIHPVHTELSRSAG